MTDEQRKRIHDIVYSCDDRAELAERIVRLEDEREMLRELAIELFPHAKRATQNGIEPNAKAFLWWKKMKEFGIEVLT